MSNHTSEAFINSYSGFFFGKSRVDLFLANLFLANLFSGPMCMHAKSLQSCPSLCHPMDWCLQGSSVHGILQARILEWAAMLSSRGSSLLWLYIIAIFHGFINMLKYRTKCCTIEQFRRSCTGGGEEPELIVTDIPLLCCLLIFYCLFEVIFINIIHLFSFYQF